MVIKPFHLQIKDGGSIINGGILDYRTTFPTTAVFLSWLAKKSALLLDHSAFSRFRKHCDIHCARRNTLIGTCASAAPWQSEIRTQERPALAFARQRHTSWRRCVSGVCTQRSFVTSTVSRVCGAESKSAHCPVSAEVPTFRRRLSDRTQNRFNVVCTNKKVNTVQGTRGT